MRHVRTRYNVVIDHPVRKTDRCDLETETTSDRQLIVLTDRRESSAAVSAQSNVALTAIALDRPVPSRCTPSRQGPGKKKHIKSECIIHVHQSHYLNTSKIRAVAKA